MKGTGLKLAQHTLRISNPDSSLAFYREKLGMSLLARRESSANEAQETHYFLGFIDTNGAGVEANDKLLTIPCTLLELIHQPRHTLPLNTRVNAENNAHYWKIGITLADVDNARERLLAAGIQVSAAKQFLDVGYMCHLNDPDGYCIELLQYDFAARHKPVLADPAYKLACAPTLGQITLRISEPESSLHFYRDLLGMRLLNRQVIAAHQFTLYFLACSDELPPNPNIDAVENREWLWQRPYTTLELQHVWRDDWQGLIHQADADAGFRRISFATGELENLVDRMASNEVEIVEPSIFNDMLKTSTVTVLDPDGNAVRFTEAS